MYPNSQPMEGPRAFRSRQMLRVSCCSDDPRLSRAAHLCCMRPGWLRVRWPSRRRCFAAQTGSAPPPFGERSSLRLNKATLRAKGAPQALLDKVGASAFRYFRMLARQVDDRTCYEFRDLRWRLPSVAVHGDAHIEQFVVTDDSYGLSDFDQSGIRPIGRRSRQVHAPRFISHVVKCNGGAIPGRRHECSSAPIVRHSIIPSPAVSRRSWTGVRATPPLDRHAWLEWAEQQMQPMPADDEQALRREWFRFVALMRETSPERPEAFYRISRVGQVAIGIGSALEPKTLIRIAGPTDSADDDYILEARITAIPDGRECVSRPANGGSLHVFMLTETARPPPSRGVRLRPSRGERRTSGSSGFSRGTTGIAKSPWPTFAVKPTWTNSRRMQARSSPDISGRHVSGASAAARALCPVARLRDDRGSRPRSRSGPGARNGHANGNGFDGSADVRRSRLVRHDVMGSSCCLASQRAAPDAATGGPSMLTCD